MSPARRDRRRRDWPRGLYEPRPGYYVWKHPKTHKTFVLGRVSLTHARNEALLANRHVLSSGPSLVAMLSGEAHTVADLLAEIPPPPKASSAKTFKALDKRIRAALGTKLCSELDVKACADLIEGIRKEGKEHHARAVRGRLATMCQRGMELGWLKVNPALVTSKPQATIARGRLSLEQFLAIRAKATEFLPRAMNLALVTGQDRSTVVAMKRADVKDGRLICQRPKTARKNAPIAIPLELRLDVLGLSLGDLLRERSSIISPYLVHHVTSYPHTPAGAPVHVDAVSAAFKAARIAAGIPDVDAEGRKAPTFHEIRSLAKRLYEQQGGVDTKTLLGHATEAMSNLYKDARSAAPVVVSVVNTK